MNKLIAKGNWNIVKGRLKQRYSKLTDDDLNYVEGREDELVGRIQRATGERREDIERFIRSEESSPTSGSPSSSTGQRPM